MCTVDDKIYLAVDYTLHDEHNGGFIILPYVTVKEPRVINAKPIV